MTRLGKPDVMTPLYAFAPSLHASARWAPPRPTKSTTEANFDTYKIFYKAGASGVTTSDTEHSDSDLLRLYEVYLKTGSPRFVHERGSVADHLVDLKSRYESIRFCRSLTQPTGLTSKRR